MCEIAVFTKQMTDAWNKHFASYQGF